jgi:glyoxylase-like metal-dependent hydrolase (beta-lactamase superfamily II)
MKITKFNHACFYLEKDSRGLLFDPVEYTNQLPTITNLDAIIITHQHNDHFQPETLLKIQSQNPNVVIFTTQDNQNNIKNALIAKHGETKKAGPFKLTFYGENHAEIIAGQIPCQNIGTLVDDYFANSADSFDAPPAHPTVLTAPVAAPWLKLSETMDFIAKTRPKIVLPAHDGLNSDLGNLISDNWLTKTCEKIGAQYKNIHFGEVR